MAEAISNIRRAKNWGFCIHQKAYFIKMELHSKGHSSNTASELNHRMLIVIPHTSCSICNVTPVNLPRFISYTERATWKILDFYRRPSSFKSTAEGWEEGCLGLNNNNNNNKIWSFNKHSNERNLFFMHNCAEILKNCRKKLNFKRIS